jgi:2,4-dienoyl-CoA reductase-like NADH-dependent reductase (Old Yellow Enzyme family)
MVPWRATEDGFVTDANVEWYGRFAAGAPGTIVVEATGIRDVASGPLLRIGHDRFIPGLGRLVDAVRARSGGRTRLLIQLIDFLRIRRRPRPDRFLTEYLAITQEHRARLAAHLGEPAHATAGEPEIRRTLVALPEASLDAILSPLELEALRFGERERVTDVHLPHVRELPAVLPELFAAAAALAQAAGFDGVELHYAHAYTMASFLSRRNDRTDGYGGSLGGRLRLPLEVLRAVRARVGARFTVGARFLCDEIIEGGNRVEDATAIGLALARGGMDFLSLSTGGKFEDAAQPRIGEAAYPYTGRSGFECMPTAIADAQGPFARNVPKQAAIRAAIRGAGLDTPVAVAGGICRFDQAEAILARGEADIIAAARQSLADPDWFEKLRTGRGDEMRACLYSNYCEALDRSHRPVTCQLWDRGPDGRRRLLPP